MSNEYQIPVYSANVNEIFGKINKKIINDFSKPSILFGIDGDWQISYIKENNEFYPTDHCGYIRIKNNINIKLNCLTHLIYLAGQFENFNRNKRPSKERIENLKIQIPIMEEQEKLSEQIEEIEKNTKELEEEKRTFDKKKKEILNKYLY